MDSVFASAPASVDDSVDGFVDESVDDSVDDSDDEFVDDSVDEFVDESAADTLNIPPIERTPASAIAKIVFFMLRSFPS